MRYLIKFSYDGTNFYGYQRQPGKRCVEDYIIEAVKKINSMLTFGIKPGLERIIELMERVDGIGGNQGN